MDANTRAQLHFEAQRKSTGAAYLLWFFLGSFGAHRFYLGQTGTAMAQLLLLLFGWLPLFLGWVVLGVWLLVDLFLIPGIIERRNFETIARLDQSGVAPAARMTV
jgi:TM2 domain-containing membrane protein YozV